MSVACSGNIISKEDEAFHEPCKDTVRRSLGNFWRQEQIDKAFRFGAIAQQGGRKLNGVFIFSRNLAAAAARKDGLC